MAVVTDIHHTVMVSDTFEHVRKVNCSLGCEDERPANEQP